MDFDFSKGPPHTETIADKDYLIKVLWNTCAATTSKLKTNSQNSSLPPSSDSPKSKAEQRLANLKK